MTRSELERQLTDLGYSLVGPAEDARYVKWARPAKGKRQPAKTVRVPQTEFILDYTAEQIVAEAGR